MIEVLVYGVVGRIASYYQNNTNYLYYFISDQLGSTRVVMKGTPPDTTYPYTVAEYYNYYPFGQVAEQSGNYPTSFQWTSKEHDQHGGFDYVYFGARYYDPKVGAFGTVGKAVETAGVSTYELTLGAAETLLICLLNPPTDNGEFDFRIRKFERQFFPCK